MPAEYALGTAWHDRIIPEKIMDSCIVEKFLRYIIRKRINELVQTSPLLIRKSIILNIIYRELMKKNCKYFTALSLIS